MKKLLLALFLALLPSVALGANCNSNPFTLTNGQTADATQVMANFNNLLNCSNNNLAHNAANSDITSLSALSTPLSVPQGGTGAATLTLNSVLLGNSTSTPLQVAPLTAGNLLTSDGTTWTSSGAGLTSITDAANGGLQFTQSGSVVTSTLSPANLLQKTTPLSSDRLMLLDVTTNTGKTSTFAQAAGALGGSLGNVIVQDRKATTTAGAALTQNTYTDHDLNTLTLNTVGGVTAVSTPNVTLPAGTYDVTAFTGSVTAAASGSFRLRLFNTTDAAVQQDINANDIVSTNVTITFAAATGLALFVRARFTLAAQKNLKFQEWTSGAGQTQGAATNGTGNSEPEIYLSAEFVKVQ